MRNSAAIVAAAVAAFCDRAGMLARNVMVLDTPHEEMVEAASRRKAIKLHASGGSLLASSRTGATARLEENYLFDTRRIASGAISAGELLFFQSAIGGAATQNGFPAGVTSMSVLETNMDVPAQIAQGKNFVFNGIGICFNADISTSDLLLALETYALKYEKQGGQYALNHGPIKFWPGGMGGAGYAAAAVGGTPLAQTSAHNGSADIRATRKLTIPRVIREKETFAYKLIAPRTVRNTDGTTAISFGSAITVSIWLFGGQQDAIPV